MTPWQQLFRQPPGTSFGHLRKSVLARRRAQALGFKLLEDGGGKFRRKVAKAPVGEMPRLGARVINWRGR